MVIQNVKTGHPIQWHLIKTNPPFAEEFFGELNKCNIMWTSINKSSNTSKCSVSLETKVLIALHLLCLYLHAFAFTHS